MYGAMNRTLGICCNVLASNLTSWINRYNVPSVNIIMLSFKVCVVKIASISCAPSL